MGKLWEPQLFDALNQAEVVIVFWCYYSAKSRCVKKKYMAAIKNKKDILPLLLDETELSHALSKYQGIDMRKIIFHIENPDFNGLEIDPPKFSSHTDISTLLIPLSTGAIFYFCFAIFAIDSFLTNLSLVSIIALFVFLLLNRQKIPYWIKGIKKFDHNKNDTKIVADVLYGQLNQIIPSA